MRVRRREAHQGMVVRAHYVVGLLVRVVDLKGGEKNSYKYFFMGNLCSPCLQTKYLVILRPGMVYERGRVYCL